MKMYSTEKPEGYAVSAQELRIRWNIKQVTAPSVNDEELTQWEANEALCSIYDERGALIEKVIGSVYDTGAEIATINNQVTKRQDYADYQDFRLLAKYLVDTWLSTKEVG
jgi:hypothetical protein